MIIERIIITCDEISEEDVSYNFATNIMIDLRSLLPKTTLDIIKRKASGDSLIEISTELNITRSTIYLRLKQAKKIIEKIEKFNNVLKKRKSRGKSPRNYLYFYSADRPPIPPPKLPKLSTRVRTRAITTANTIIGK